MGEYEELIENDPVKTVARVYANVFEGKPPSLYEYDNFTPKLEDINDYTIIRRLGQGKYSMVFEGMNEKKNENVVVKILKPVRRKKIKREIKILDYLKGGVNIVKLLAVVSIPSSDLNGLIFEQMENNEDFKSIYMNLNESDTRYYMYEVLRALDYCHSKGIMHRDVKPQNIIVDQKNKRLRLIDWGLAEFYHPKQEYNVRVASRYFKGPELLVDYGYYDYSLDIWSVGCMFAAMIFRRDPFFHGYDNYDQLLRIVKILGTGDLFTYLEKYNISLDEKFVDILGQHHRKNWQRFVTTENEYLICESAISLLECMLKYDHMKRISAREALEHPYFLPLLRKQKHSSATPNLNNLTLMKSEAESIISFNINISDERDAKWFGIGIVRIANSVCTGSNGLDGTCYTRYQCRAADGFSSGRCAQNVGYCCIIQRTCGQSSSLNNTYFSNVNASTAIGSGGSCTMTIIRCNPDICQVRIDFLTSSLAQPNNIGVCNSDSLMITGGGGRVPIICGENNGQHIYVDFNGNNSIQMVTTTLEGLNIGRNWNYKITQIACGCPTKAPTGCLMYYTGLTGTVRSFNYGTATAFDPTTGLRGTRELVNENYGVCISMAPGYCSIEWSSCNANSFIVSDNDAAINPPQTLYGADCDADFVIIPNPFLPDGTAAPSDRICGNLFPTVISFSKPFVLTVVTNNNEMSALGPDTGNVGFCLNYRQRLCTANDNAMG
ncbi:hypothetical protein WA026_016353 [Henosepilachna vigintioctopunctata]|uniref:Casein kinase II subunit alpha n=1 Tax=Henosepilachna vigintioctopunctata TaxID=420089 RepID=A0AAW1UL40_9CUCU